jgi:hypothetical protein
MAKGKIEKSVGNLYYNSLAQEWSNPNIDKKRF